MPWRRSAGKATSPPTTAHNATERKTAHGSPFAPQLAMATAPIPVKVSWAKEIWPAYPVSGTSDSVTTAVKNPVSSRLRLGPLINEPTAATTATNEAALISANRRVGGRDGVERRAVPLAVSRSCGWKSITANSMTGGSAWLTARRLTGPIVLSWFR